MKHTFPLQSRVSAPEPAPAPAPPSGPKPRHFALAEGALLTAVLEGAAHHSTLMLLAAAASGELKVRTEVRADRAARGGWAIRATVWDEGEISPGIHAGANIDTWVLTGDAAPGDPDTAEAVQAEWRAFLARRRGNPRVVRRGALVEE